MSFLIRNSKIYRLILLVVVLTYMVSPFSNAWNCPDGSEGRLLSTSYFWYDSFTQPDTSNIAWSSPVLKDSQVNGTDLKLTYEMSRVIPVKRDKGTYREYECPSGTYGVYDFTVLATMTITRTETREITTTVTGSYETQTLVGDEEPDLGPWDQVVSSTVTGLDVLGRVITVVTVLVFLFG